MPFPHPHETRQSWLKRISIVLFFVNGLNVVISQDSIQGSGAEVASELNPPPSKSQIQTWFAALQSESYASRNIAFSNLQLYPSSTIPLVESAFESADEESAGAIIRLLNHWAKKPDQGYGQIAFEILEKFGKNNLSARESLARSAVEGIAEQQSVIAIDRLKDLSAFVGQDSLQVISTKVYKDNVLRIDDAFRGTPDDLESLRWVKGVELVRLDGERIDRKWLEKIVRIPSIQILQLRHTSIKNEDLNLIRSINNLDTLEIIYTPIDDGAIESLANLSIWGALRIFGTRMTVEASKELEKKLEGTQLVFGRGGFLGIASNTQTLELSQITEGSGAEKAGLRLRDKIISINNRPLANFDELRKELSNFAANEVVTVEFDRPEGIEYYRPTWTRQVLQVTLGEQPER